MDNSQVSSSQTSFVTRLWVIFFLAIIPILLLTIVWQQSETSSQQWQKTALPTWQKTIVNQQQLLLLHDNINEILASKKSAEYSLLHQKITTVLENLALQNNEANLFTTLLKNHRLQNKTIARINEQALQNEQLKNQALILITKINRELAQLINQLQQQQSLLHQQISKDGITDKVTVNRAKALAKVVEYRSNTQQLLLLTTQLHSLLNELSIQAPLTTLKNIASQSEHIFLVYDELITNEQENSSLSNTITAQLNQLEGIFLTQGNLLAKWRGQLRLAAKYRQWLANIVEQTQPLNKLKSNISPQNIATVTPPVIHYIQQIIPQFTAQHFYMLVYGIITLFALLLVIALHSFFKAQHKEKQKFYLTLQQYLNDQELLESAQKTASSEQEQQLLSQLSNIQQPQVNQQKYQQLLTNFELQTQLLATQQQVCFWQYPLNNLSPSQQQLLNAILLAAELTTFTNKDDKAVIQITSWRQFFNRENCLLLLQQARKAKQTQQIQTINIESKAGVWLEVSVEYRAKQWCGCVINIDKLIAVKQQNQQLLSEYDQQHQQLAYFLDKQQDTINIALNQLLLQIQNLSLTNVSIAPLHRLLRRVINQHHYTALGSEYLLANNENLLTPLIKPLTLMDINLEDELSSAVINVNNIAAEQHNTLYLQYQHNILPWVKTDGVLLQTLLQLAAEVMFKQQTHNELLLAVSLKDKNAGQQTLTIALSLFDLKAISAEKIQQLHWLTLPSEPADNLPTTILALQALFKRLSVNTVELLETEQAFTFQFSLPLALTSEQQTLPVFDLKEQHFLMIGENKRVKNYLTAMMKNSNGYCHQLTKVELFAQQYSVKQLTKQPVKAIILTSECYQTSSQLITQHLHSLPKSLQPKVMVLQNDNNTNIMQQGLFSLANTPLLTTHFISQLQQLLANENTSNLLFDEKALASYCYQTTQVAVLLAVKNVPQHQILQRLLSFLGLQVTLVSNQACLADHWHSGRYMILISDFVKLPNLMVHAGKTVNRAIFSLLKEQPTDIIIEVPDYGKNWRIEQIENALDLNELSQKLSPWLKIKANKTQKAPTAKTLTAKTLTDNHQEKVKKSTTKASTRAETQINEQVFDLSAYAINQGSPQLAAFMLEEYLSLLTSHVTKLEQHLTTNTEQSLKSLETLCTIATIMAASNLLNACNELQQALLAEKDNDAQDQLSTLFTHVKQQLSQLVALAEAI